MTATIHMLPGVTVEHLAQAALRNIDALSFDDAVAAIGAPAERGAPDFRYSRECISGAPVWRVTVRTYGSPVSRDETHEINAADADMAAMRALGRVRREQNVPGRHYLPAIEVVRLERVTCA